MSSLKRLDASTIHQVCSTQVITSVSSVVKELVENALDAGATRIEVECADDGASWIRVADNGHGMDLWRDRSVIGVRHATSKQSGASPGSRVKLEGRENDNNAAEEEEEVTGVTMGAPSTLGFRGEALHSLAAVGDLSIASVTARDCGKSHLEGSAKQPLHALFRPDGAMARLSDADGRLLWPPTEDAALGVAWIPADTGSMVTHPSASGHATGTVVTVRNLFLRMPVRRKELEKCGKRQLSQAVDVARELALSKPGVSFFVGTATTTSANSSNGGGNGANPEASGTLMLSGRKTVFSTRGTGELKSATVELFGSRFLKALQPFRFEDVATVGGSSGGSSVTVHGLISVVGEGRPSNDMQYVFVDGRPAVMPKWFKMIVETFVAAHPAATPKCPVIILFVEFSKIHSSAARSTGEQESTNVKIEATVMAEGGVGSSGEDGGRSSTTGKQKALEVMSRLAYDVNMTPDKRTLLINDERELLAALQEKFRLFFSGALSQAILPKTVKRDVLSKAEDGDADGGEDAADSSASHTELMGMVRAITRSNAGVDAVELFRSGSLQKIPSGGAAATPTTKSPQADGLPTSSSSATPSPFVPQKGPVDDATPVGLPKGGPPPAIAPCCHHHPRESTDDGKDKELDFSAFSESSPTRKFGSGLGLVRIAPSSQVSDPWSGGGIPTVEEPLLIKTAIDASPSSTAPSNVTQSTPLVASTSSTPSKGPKNSIAARGAVDFIDARAKFVARGDEQIDGQSASWQRFFSKMVPSHDEPIDVDRCVEDEDTVEIHGLEPAQEDTLLDAAQERRRNMADYLRWTKKHKHRRRHPSQLYGGAVDWVGRLRWEALEANNSSGSHSNKSKRMRTEVKSESSDSPPHRVVVKDEFSQAFPSPPSDQAEEEEDGNEEPGPAPWLPLTAPLQAQAQQLSVLLHKRSFQHDMTVIGQFNRGFIVCLFRHSDFFIVDQHAADEKANYEMLCQQYQPKPQPLVVPVRLVLDAEEVEVAWRHEKDLRAHGFLLCRPSSAAKGGRGGENNHHDDDGESMSNTLCVSAIPVLPYETVKAEDIQELTSQLMHCGSGQIISPLRAVWHSMATKACRTSIMIGATLDGEIMKRVVRRLSELDHPWNCPHGRPTLRHVGKL